MSEERIPTVRPKEEVWDFCVRLAKEHNSTPLDVLKRLVMVGERVAKIEQMGGSVSAKIAGREIPIEVFEGR